MPKAPGRSEYDFSLQSMQIFDLILAKRFQEAESMIVAAERTASSNDAHRLTGLAALIEEGRGNLAGAIELMRKAADQRPGFLPHLFGLSCCLMDAERWSEASIVLDEVISLSESRDDHYFLNNARFRRFICAKALGRDDEADQIKARIPPGATAFLDCGEVGRDDLE